jgi:hypothetical protein
MKTLKLNSCYALAAAAAFGLTACATEGTGPTSLSPSSARFHAVGDVVADATPEVGVVKLCKEGNVSGDFTVGRTPFGPASSGQVISPVSVASGECKVVATDVSPDGSASDIVIDETSAGFVSAAYVGTAGSGSGAYVDATTPLRINQYHGFTVTYVNHVDQDVGCTYTQGWYKNPKHDWPSGDIQRGTSFDGGAGAEAVLNTPPKGNVYYVLAHQYITALLNIQGGASSDDITQALADAADYFADASVANPLPAGWTKDEVTAIADILDDYNNGLIGPGHCDDEVLEVVD